MLSVVVDNLLKKRRENKSAVVVVYFGADQKHDRSTSDLLNLIVKQVLQQTEVFPPTLLDIYDYPQRSYRGCGPNPKQLKEILTLLAPAFETLFYVFEGLGETGEAPPGFTLRKFIRFIKELAIGNGRVLLVSRPHPVSLQEASGYSSLRWDIVASDFDIDMLISSRIKEDGRLLERYGILCEVRQNIVQRSAGSFALAVQ